MTATYRDVPVDTVVAESAMLSMLTSTPNHLAIRKSPSAQKQCRSGEVRRGILGRRSASLHHPPVDPELADVAEDRPNIDGGVQLLFRPWPAWPTLPGPGRRRSAPGSPGRHRRSKGLCSISRFCLSSGIVLFPARRQRQFDLKKTFLPNPPGGFNRTSVLYGLEGWPTSLPATIFSASRSSTASFRLRLRSDRSLGCR